MSRRTIIEFDHDNLDALTIVTARDLCDALIGSDPALWQILKLAGFRRLVERDESIGGTIRFDDGREVRLP